MLSTGLAFAAVMFLTSSASAKDVDLTTVGSSGTINGGLFQQGNFGSGTGVFPSFVQIQTNLPTEEAYNTTQNNVLNNASDDTHNHEIFFSDLNTVTVGGVDYYSFLLDANESNNDIAQYISLDELKIITSSSGNQSGALPTGTVRYDMNAAAGSDAPPNHVLIDYNLSSGSGTSDLRFLVPVANFANIQNTNEGFVYLYSKFGAVGTVNAGTANERNYGPSDGFEEWALQAGTHTQPPCTLPPCSGGGGSSPVPEPASLLLLGSGLAAAAARFRKTRNRD